MDAGDRDALLELLHGILRSVAEERSTITYQELLDRLPGDLPSDGPQSLPALLRTISKREHREGRPMLSAVVVRRSGRPGGGFFRLAHELGRAGADTDSIWSDEIESVYDCYAGEPR